MINEEPPVNDDIASNLQRSVIAPLKHRFVGREEVVDLIALALVAGEHLFLYGPPGTAKSALIRAFAQSVAGRYFEYLLTRFSEPNELFGPIDLVKLREGTVTTVITGMLPEAEFVFLDELFNANSAILNNLLTVLNERIFRRARKRISSHCYRFFPHRIICPKMRLWVLFSTDSCCAVGFNRYLGKACLDYFRPVGNWNAG